MPVVGGRLEQDGTTPRHLRKEDLFQGECVQVWYSIDVDLYGDLLDVSGRRANLELAVAPGGRSHLA